MGQCCGFVKSDKGNTLTTTQREEQYLEIEKAIKNMEDGDKKKQLLQELNHRSSLVYSKESYQDVTDIKHKIYQGPNKDPSNLNAISKEDIGSQISAAKQKSMQDGQMESEIKNCSKDKDATADDAANGNSTEDKEKQQQNGVENQSTTHNDSKLNAIKDPGGSKGNDGKPGSQLHAISQTSPLSTSQQIKQKSKEDFKSGDKANRNNSKEKISSNNNINLNSSKQQGSKESDPKKSQNINNSGIKDKQEGAKCVGFDLEEIEREMKKAGRIKNGEQQQAQTDYDNQSTKTEKQVKGVLKKYNDAASCYTGGDKNKSKKKKKVIFKDPQKPKKKPGKRQYH